MRCLTSIERSWSGIRRGSFSPGRCRGRLSTRPSPWPSTRRRIPTSNRGGWCSSAGPPVKVTDHEAPHIPGLPKAFEHYRYKLGAEVYGSMGYY